VKRSETVVHGRLSKRRKLLLWLVPVVALIHNVEQVLTIGPTMELTRTGVPRALRLVVPPVPPAEYIAALVLSTLGGFAFAWWGKVERGAGVYLLGSLQMALLLNVGAHGAASAVTGSYTAGLATSLGVVLPYSLVLFWFLLQERWIPRRAFPLLVLGGVILHLPIFFGLLFVAAQIPLPGR
jgi:hypothetical protein